MDEQLHSPARRLIELRIAHAELDGRIDALTAVAQAGAGVGAHADAHAGSHSDARAGASAGALVEAGPPADGEGDLTLPLVDELTLRRLKKQRLALRDQIARLERASDPDEPA